jgi:rod shape-determining protein MreD
VNGRYSTTKLVAWAAVLLAAELTLFERWSVKGARAEALLALACFAALFAKEPRQALLACWIIGLLKDVASAGPLGLHALLFVAAGWVVLQVRTVLFPESPLTQLAVAFIATCWVNAAAAAAVALSAGTIPFGVVAAKTLLSALLTAVLTPFLLATFTHVRWMVR